MYPSSWAITGTAPLCKLPSAPSACHYERHISPAAYEIDVQNPEAYRDGPQGTMLPSWIMHCLLCYARYSLFP